MEGFLLKTPAQLGRMDSVAWQNFYLNTSVGLMTFCGFCGMEKTYNLFFMNKVLYIPLKISLAFCCLMAIISDFGEILGHA